MICVLKPVNSAICPASPNPLIVPDAAVMSIGITVLNPTSQPDVAVKFSESTEPPPCAV